jgi:hypothetical protein
LSFRLQMPVRTFEIMMMERLIAIILFIPFGFAIAHCYIKAYGFKWTDTYNSSMDDCLDKIKNHLVAYVVIFILLIPTILKYAID